MPGGRYEVLNRLGNGVLLFEHTFAGRLDIVLILMIDEPTEYLMRSYG
jgi:hypothetical protein